MNRFKIFLFFLFFSPCVLAQEDIRTYIGFGLSGKLTNFEDGDARDTKFSDFFKNQGVIDDYSATDDIAHDDSVFGAQIQFGFRQERTGLGLECEYIYRADYNPEINGIEAETNIETKYCLLKAKYFARLNHKWEFNIGAGIGYAIHDIELLSLKYEAQEREYKVDLKSESSYKDLVWNASIGFERHMFRNWYLQGDFGWYDFGKIRLDEEPVSLRANRSAPSFFIGMKRYSSAPRYVEMSSNWIERFKSFMQEKASIELYGYTRHDPNGSGGYRTKDGKRHRWNNRNFGLGVAIDLYEPMNGLLTFRGVMGNFRNSYRRDAWYYGVEAAANLPVGRLPIVPNCARLSYGVRGAYVSGYDKTQLRANKYQRAGFQFFEVGCNRVTIRMTCLFDNCTNIRTFSLTYALGPRRKE